MGDVDWSKAGTRLRHTSRTPAHGGRNPDWNFREQRWKDELDYECDALVVPTIVRIVGCAECGAARGSACVDARGNAMADGVHPIRCRHAAERKIVNGSPPSP